MSDHALSLSKQEQISRALAAVGLDVHVGEYFIDHDGRHLRIESITSKENGEVAIVVASKWDGSWHHAHTYTAAEFAEARQKHRLLPLGHTLEDVAALEEEALRALANPAALDPWAGSTPSTSTALASVGSKERALQLEAALTAQMEKVETMRRIIKARTEALRDMVSGMEARLTLLHKILGIFELYLGTREQITQIADGAPAPAEEKLYLFQEVLCMDEECGDPRYRPETGQPGIDFGSVEAFDAWLLADPAHLEQVLPVKKGIRALRPSRQERTYVENPIANAWINANNGKTYLLCRNGDKLYRVWTDIVIGDRLFPSQAEADGTFDLSRHDFEAARSQQMYYQRHGAIVQGLLDRTPIFQPLPHPLNVFDAATYGEVLALVYDTDPALYTGQEYYPAWRERLNAGIRVGSRIVVAVPRAEASHTRFYAPQYYRDSANVPPPPPPGIYTVEDILPPRKGQFYATEERLLIRYNPHDEVWRVGWEWDPHPRKNRVTYIVYRRDYFVLHYDMLELAAVEHYIASRLERRKYLEIIPLLWTVRDALRAEREWEEQFVHLVVSRVGCASEVVRAAVAWWKSKVRATRPLTLAWQRNKEVVKQTDPDLEAKALRMVEARVRRQMALVE